MQQTLYVGNLFFFEAAIQVAVGNFPRQVQCTQYQLPGFVPGIVRTMAKNRSSPWKRLTAQRIWSRKVRRREVITGASSRKNDWQF